MALEDIKPGLSAEVTHLVEEKHTPPHIPGKEGVLATPWMIAFMEEASRQATDHILDANQTTVGTVVNIKHLAPCPVGAMLRVTSRLLEVNGRHLTFQVEAYSGGEKIGEGIHERYIIDLERFKKRLEEKRASLSQG